MLRRFGFLLVLGTALSAGAVNRIGDADNDGTVTMQDARLVQRALLGLDPPTALSPLGVMNPDYNLDLRDLFDSARHAASGLSNRNGHAPGMISVGGMGDFTAYNDVNAMGVPIQWSVQSNLALMAEMTQGLEATIEITTPGVGSSLGGVDGEVRADGTIRATFYPNETALTLVNVRLTIQVRDSDGSSVIEQHVDNLTIEVGPVSPAEYRCQQSKIAYEQVKQNLALEVVRCRQDYFAYGVCADCDMAANNAAALISGNHPTTTSYYVPLLGGTMPSLGNRAAPFNQTLPAVTSLGIGSVSPFSCPTTDGAVGVSVVSGFNDNVPGHCNVAVCRDLSFDPACGEIGPVVEYVHDPYWDDPTPFCDQARANYEMAKSMLETEIVRCRISSATDGLCTMCSYAIENVGYQISGLHPSTTTPTDVPYLGLTFSPGSASAPFDINTPAATFGNLTAYPPIVLTNYAGEIVMNVSPLPNADVPGYCQVFIGRDLSFMPACGESQPVVEVVADPLVIDPTPRCDEVRQTYETLKTNLQTQIANCRASAVTNGFCASCTDAAQNACALISGYSAGTTCSSYYPLTGEPSPLLGDAASPFDPTTPAVSLDSIAPGYCPSNAGTVSVGAGLNLPQDENPGTCSMFICRNLLFEPACGEPFPIVEQVVDPIVANPAPFCQEVVDRFNDVRQELLNEMEAAQVSNTFNFTGYTCEEVLTNVLFKHEGDHPWYPGNPCTPIQPFSCPANPGEEYNAWTLYDMALDLGSTAMLGNVVIECADPLATSNMVVNIQRDLSNELGCGEPGAVGESLVRFYCGNLITETPLESCDDGDLSECGPCNADCTGPSLPDYCGDLQVCGVEACDDGLGGACFDDCSAVNYCGDGIAFNGEACDDGPGGSCLDDCSAVNVCGDGTVFNGEVCDDGNTISCDGCQDDCTRLDNVCGDSITECAEFCDDGNATECGLCNYNCTNTSPADYCGDFQICAGEVCDDGDTDSCTPLCNETCTGPGSAPVCGDGVTTCGEACDDGDSTECGQCNYNCTGPSPVDYCGDFQICDGEACDDGPANGSTPCGCQASCQFTTAGSECRAISGVCDQAETCPGGGMACPPNGFLPSPTLSEFFLCSEQASAQGGSCATATCSGDSINVTGNVGADCADDAAGTLTMTHVFNTQSPSGTAFKLWLRIVRDTSRDGGTEDYTCDLGGVNGGGNLQFFLTETDTGNGVNGPGCIGVDNTWCWAAANNNNPILLDSGPHILICSSTSNSTLEDGGHDGIIVTTDLAYIPAENANACDSDASFTAGTCNTPPLNWGPTISYSTGTLCRGSTGDCDVAEACDGLAATCPTDAFVTAGAACDNGSGEPDADYCNGAGGCINPTCRDGVVDAGEACDDFPHNLGLVHSNPLAGMPPKDAVIYGSRGYLATGDGRLVVVDMSPPLYSVIGQYDTPGSSFGVTVVGNRAYVSDGPNGMVILDVTNPTPTLVTSYDTGGFAYDAFVFFNRAYVADGPGGLVVLDIMTTPPTLVTSTAVGGTAWDLVIEGNLAYVATDAAGLTVWDVTVIPPTLVGQVGTGGIATGVSLAGTRAYVGAWNSGGLRVFDVAACPGGSCTPILIGSYDSPANAHHAFLRGARAYLADWDGGVQVLDITNPQPVWIGSYNTPGNVYAVSVANAVALVADDTGGFAVLDVSENGQCGFFCGGTVSCGDGLVQSPEACDDGAGLNGTCGFCNANCLGDNLCGNGIVDPACGETCDDGVNNGGSTPGVCNGGCTGYVP